MNFLYTIYKKKKKISLLVVLWSRLKKHHKINKWNNNKKDKNLSKNTTILNTE